MAFILLPNTILFKECIETNMYFDNFNDTDKRLRSCVNCKDDYYGSIRVLNNSEYDFLYPIIQRINDMLSGYLVFKEIPWKILICHDKESQFPHTHGVFIVLPDNFIKINNLMKLLLHEKVHIYQRLYPCQTNILFTRFWGFNIKNMLNKKSRANRRSNPDINKIVYVDENGNEFDNNYVENATSLGEIKDRRDHPNEMMAYILQDMLLPLPLLCKSNQSKSNQSIENWLKLGFF